jgi:hypothetical protein
VICIGAMMTLGCWLIFGIWNSVIGLVVGATAAWRHGGWHAVCGVGAAFAAAALVAYARRPRKAHARPDC